MKPQIRRYLAVDRLGLGGYLVSGACPQMSKVKQLAGQSQLPLSEVTSRRPMTAPLLSPPEDEPITDPLSHITTSILAERGEAYGP